MRFDDNQYDGPGTASTPNPTATTNPTDPAAPPAAPPGTVQTAAAYDPNYGDIIKNDPGYASAQAGAAQAQGQAAAQRKQQLQQAIIQYGGLPDGFKDQYGDLDQATLDQAKQNQFSTLANLGRNYTQSESQFKRQLAARGMLQSGDLNYGEDQLNTQYGQQRYDATNALGGNVNSALNAYTGVLKGNADSLTNAIQQAEGSAYSNPAYRPTPAKTANYDAKQSAQYGTPVYTDDAGNVFDQNGNPFDPAAYLGTSLAGVGAGYLGDY